MRKVDLVTDQMAREPAYASPPIPVTHAHHGVVADPIDPEAELSLPPEVDAPRRALVDLAELPVSRETEPTFPRPPRPRVMVVANQKGGVGKTTTTVNLAAALATGGLNTLVIDLDPQGNASTALGIPHSAGVPGTYEAVVDGAEIARHVVSSPEAPGLVVLPATVDLAGAEVELVTMYGRENRLRTALAPFLATQPVDYVLIDCPPSLGLLTVNALVAADELLLPIQAEYYALEGVSQLLTTINLVKRDLNTALDLSTVLITMYDARTRLSLQVADEVRRHFPTQTLETIIPRSVRVSEAPSYGQTVLTYDPTSVGAKAYRAAAAEIAQRGVPATTTKETI